MKLSFFKIVALVIVLSSQSHASPPDAGKQSGKSVAGGKTVYRKACRPCHGVNGDGQGPVAQYLTPKPRDFTKGIYKFTSTPSGLPTDEDLFTTVTRGVPGTSMPAWGRLLSDQERWSAVQFIKTFSPKFKKRKPKPPIEIPADIPEATAESITEGRLIYAVLKCWNCHGKAGKGDGPSAETLKDSWDNPIKPYDFTKAGGLYKGGSSAADVYRTFTTGLRGTPMPAFAQALGFTRESLEDLTAYQELFTPSEIDEIRVYANGLITKAGYDKLAKDERTKLVDERRWSLVHYVKSLSEPESLFYGLFVKDTEVTR